MEHAFPEAEVTGYESLVAGMQNDPKDRHVAAAALKAGAQVATQSDRYFSDVALVARKCASRAFTHAWRAHTPG